MAKNAAAILALAAALPLAVASCDNSTGLSDDVLDLEEASALASMMTASLQGAAEQQIATSPSAATVPNRAAPAAAGDLQLDWEGVIPCEPSGQVELVAEINATFDHKKKEAKTFVEAAVTHNDCTFVTKKGTFVVNGNLEFTGQFHSVAKQPKGEQVITLAGGFTWEGDGDRSGGCDVDLTGKLLADASTRTLDGTFCGWELELELPHE